MEKRVRWMVSLALGVAGASGCVATEEDVASDAAEAPAADPDVPDVDEVVETEPLAVEVRDLQEGCGKEVIVDGARYAPEILDPATLELFDADPSVDEAPAGEPMDASTERRYVCQGWCFFGECTVFEVDGDDRSLLICACDGFGHCEWKAQDLSVGA